MFLLCYSQLFTQMHKRKINIEQRQGMLKDSVYLENLFVHSCTMSPFQKDPKMLIYNFGGLTHKRPNNILIL